MNSQPFWDFINEAYRHGPAGPGGPGGPRAHRGRDFQNWQDMFGNGFPFGPMPHRGRPGPPHHGPQHHPTHDTPVNGAAETTEGVIPPRPSTPPTPPEELPEYPGPERHRRSESHSPPAHFLSGQERGDDSRTRHQARRDERHQRRDERREERKEERRERRARHDERHEHGPRGPFGRRGRGGPAFPVNDFINSLPFLANYYANQVPGFVNNFFPNDVNAAGASDAARDVPAGSDVPRGDGSFSIDVDVFSTTEAYLIHASVPGAKKSDIDVSYDAANNTVNITGVIQRPAEVDEVMLSAMIEGDRDVGLFERKVYLDADTKVDAEGLRAKLEDGVLRIELPKDKEEGWTDVKKVQVE